MSPLPAFSVLMVNCGRNWPRIPSWRPGPAKVRRLADDTRRLNGLPIDTGRRRNNQTVNLTYCRSKVLLLRWSFCQNHRPLQFVDSLKFQSSVAYIRRLSNNSSTGNLRKIYQTEHCLKSIKLVHFLAFASFEAQISLIDKLKVSK